MHVAYKYFREFQLVNKQYKVHLQVLQSVQENSLAFADSQSIHITAQIF